MAFIWVFLVCEFMDCTDSTNWYLHIFSPHIWFSLLFRKLLRPVYLPVDNGYPYNTILNNEGIQVNGAVLDSFADDVNSLTTCQMATSEILLKMV